MTTLLIIQYIVLNYNIYYHINIVNYRHFEQIWDPQWPWNYIYWSLDDLESLITIRYALTCLKTVNICISSSNSIVFTYCKSQPLWPILESQMTLNWLLWILKWPWGQFQDHHWRNLAKCLKNWSNIRFSRFNTL